MKRVIVQVPMSNELRESSQLVSEELGFSSVQEAIRVLLTKFAKRELMFTVTERVEEITHLSPAAERKFKKAVKDIKAGRNITKTKNVDELLTLLYS